MYSIREHQFKTKEYRIPVHDFSESGLGFKVRVRVVKSPGKAYTYTYSFSHVTYTSSASSGLALPSKVAKNMKQ